MSDPLDALPPPADPARPSNRLLDELLSHVTEQVVVAYATGLLDGEDPARHPTALRYLGGAHAGILLDSRDFAFWPAVWGARALQHVWTPHQAGAAGEVVVAHVGDESWRVAEMCSKVIARRELGGGADALVALTAHRLPRVRLNALRALGAVGEREHLGVIADRLADGDADVRRSAVRALDRCAIRLDVDVDRLLDGGPRS